MKRILLVLIASIAFGGSVLAQSYETHWPDFDLYEYEQHGSIVANVKIDDNLILETDNYEALEVAALANGTIRGKAFMLYQPEYGDLYPIVELEVYYDPNASDTGKEVSFLLYDHSTEREYDIFTCSVDLLTGDDNLNYGDPMVISFTSSFTKEIAPWTDGGGYYFIASPLNAAVSPADVENMTSNEFDLYYFDQAASDGKEWINIHDGNTSLVSGKGYLYANSGNNGETITLKFIGAPYNGNGQVTLTKTENVEFSGWNLVGNPWAETAYITKEFYRLNDDGSNVITGSGNEVGPMEGIFVIAESDGETMTFSTDNQSKANGLVINVNKNRGSVVDRAIVRFEEGGMLPKFMLNENHTKLYIPQDGKNYAVVTTKSNVDEMPLNFKASEEGTYTLNFNAEDFETGYLHLIDNLTGNDVDLLENPSYTFNARISDYTSRFRLVFNATGINSNNVNNGSFAIVNNGNLIINGVEGKATLEMIDVTGRTISAETINGDCIKAVKVKAGVYTLRLIQGESIRTQKVVVE